MARAFTRTRRGITTRLDEQERRLLTQVFTDVHGLLGEGAEPVDPDPLAAAVGLSTATEPPADPALARLLPTGHRDDDEAAADYRRYTERGLRDDKRAQLFAVLASLERSDPLLLSDSEAVAWLRSLTDVRLVLGERLELRADDDLDLMRDQVEADPDPDEDVQSLGLTIAVYDFLTWLQETLAGVLLGELPEGEDDPRAAGGNR